MDEREGETGYRSGDLTLFDIIMAVVAFLLGCVLVLLLGLAMGWLATKLLPFDLFQATLMCLGAMAITGQVMLSIMRALSSTPMLDRVDELEQLLAEMESDAATEGSRTRRGRRPTLRS